MFQRKDNLQNPSPPEPASDVFPYVFTTYRLTEHHTAGGMSRWLPYLSELQPEFFCEVSPELARERGLEHLGWATIVTARTAIEARVLVTDRMVPLHVDGRTVHQVGLPYHWGVGSSALVSGDSANDLFGVTLDPNVHIQESKVASCDIQPGRRPTGPALLRFVEEYRSRAGITVETGNEQRTPEDIEWLTNSSGPDPHVAEAPAGRIPPARKGFFTDTSICIGCKACEVACKEWNGVPDDGFNLLGSSYDNTGALGASTWRHVAFIEQPRWPPRPDRVPLADVLGRLQALHARGLPGRLPDRVAVPHRVRHGRRAGRHLQRLRLLRAGLPVRRDRPAHRRRARRRTSASRRSARCATTGSSAGHMPACAQACPTESIQFGDLDELRERAAARVEALHDAGVPEARLYGEDPDDGIGGGGAIFLLLDEPEVYGLPPDPVVTTHDLPAMWKQAGLAALALGRGGGQLVPRPAPVTTSATRRGRGDGGAGGAGRRVHVVLRPAGRQGIAVGERHPGLPVPGRARGAGRRCWRPVPTSPVVRRCGAPDASARWSRSRSASPRWCTTWASRRGS